MALDHRAASGRDPVRCLYHLHSGHRERDYHLRHPSNIVPSHCVPAPLAPPCPSMMDALGISLFVQLCTPQAPNSVRASDATSKGCPGHDSASGSPDTLFSSFGVELQGMLEMTLHMLEDSLCLWLHVQPSYWSERRCPMMCKGKAQPHKTLLLGHRH